MADSSVTIDGLEDGYSVEFGGQNSELEVHDDGLSASVAQTGDSEAVDEPYPGYRTDYLYCIASANSAVAAQIIAILMLASSCIASGNVVAVLTQINTKAFGSAFSSAFK